MSHFTTVVVVDGQHIDDPEIVQHLAELMLAPFDEQREDIKPYRDYEEGPPRDHWAYRSLLEEKMITSDVSWAVYARAFNAEYADEDGDGLFVEAGTGRAYTMSRYNRQAKWDWYALGGRWRGFFTVKAGVDADVRQGQPGAFGNPIEPGTADLIRKRDIDFDMMRRTDELRAEEEFAPVELTLAGFDLTEYRSWPNVREEQPDIEQARAVYNAQPVATAFRLANPNAFMIGVDDFLLGETDLDRAHKRYVELATGGVGVPFAVLDSEGWHERGHMGWFGVSLNEVDQADWNSSVRQMYDKLPDDAWLLNYDCHI